MPLDKNSIENSINELVEKTKESKNGQEEFAKGLAQIIYDAIKSADVTSTIEAGSISVGIPISDISISGNLA